MFPGKALPQVRPPNTLSVCLIVRDEEQNLADCLKSVRDFADEIVVVDTGSTDGTVAVAERFSAKVITSRWIEDFSYSRNISLDHAACRWILWLDADDRVPLSEGQKIALLKKSPPDRAFYMRIRNVRPGGFGEQWFQLRMFPNHPRIRFERKAHEQVVFSIQRLHLPLIKENIRIDHVGYQNRLQQKKKALRNRNILLADLSRHREDPAYMSALGDSFFISGEFPEARDWYIKVLEIPEGSRKQRDVCLQAYTSIALCCQKLGDYQSASEWIEKGLEADPGKIDNLFLAAEIKEKTGDWQKAVGYYQRAANAPSIMNSYALDSEGLKARALVRLGTLCKENGQEDQAEKYFREGIEKYPQVINCYHALGDLLTEKGKYPEAESFFRRAIDLRRGNPKGYMGLAKTLACAGRLSEAAKTLEEAKKILGGISQKEKSPLL
jgi:glycosyltransferase involved in cell wall biosynthesis